MNPTKTERRFLAAEKSAKAKPAKSLLTHLAEKLLRKRLTTGSRLCQCGATISANKPACLACVEKHRTISDVLREQSESETPGANVIHVPIPASEEGVLRDQAVKS